MKKNIIIAAIAAASALLLCASCQKQELVEQNNVNAEGKTFTATIEQGLTKTTITSEYKVNWETGDQIDINGSIFSATPDASDATKASLTKVSGSDPTPGYTAVYPASIMVGAQATLPATQTYAEGKFNAPMCAMSSTETLEFKNFCGVLCFALKGTDKVKSIAVTANEQICGSFEFTTAPAFDFTGGEGKTVTLDCGEGVQLSSTDSTNFYVYLPPKDSYTAGMKIVVTSTEGKTFEKTTTTAVKIERNNLYTFDWTASFSGSAEPEYVEIGGVKWATKNLGAKKVTDYGDYFAWGATELAYSSLSSNTFTFVASRPASYGGSGWIQSKGFDYDNTPYYNGSTYTKYTSSDSKTVLESGDDAATALLGSGWRMPTKEDFQNLYDACVNGAYDKTTYASATCGESTTISNKGVYWCGNYDGVAGCLFYDGVNRLFFPAAGNGINTSLLNAGSSGSYWSSSLYTGADIAYRLSFGSGSVSPQSFLSRFAGFPVRPVKAAAAPTPTTTGTAKATIGGSQVDVKWVQLWENGPKFAEYNVGAANNKAEDYGGYYCWGKTVDQDENGDYKTGTDALTGDDDTATNLWGSNWRMPTADELGKRDGSLNYVDGLLGKCTVEWIDGITKKYNDTDAKGLLCTGKGDYASNSVFLPAAGDCFGTTFRDQGTFGYYWSSTPDGSDNAYYLIIRSDYPGPGVHPYPRFDGYSVRAVLAE